MQDVPILNLLPPFLQPYAATIAAIIAVCSAVATFTPTTHPNPVVNFLLGAINFVALNFGKAKNADAAPKDPPSSAAG